MSLVVGHIDYLNCVPFFHYLKPAEFQGRIVKGVPSHLNTMLAEGSIDVSPSSSFEYGKNWRDYLLLPDLSISSCGPVQSVLLFSGQPLESLEGGNIALTGESATSVNLLKVLLWEFLGYREVVCSVPDRPVEEVVAEGLPALLIGDRALRAARESWTAPYIYDLGELWYRFSGLPFVFGLWILRREAAQEKQEAVRMLQSQLQESLRLAFADLPTLAKVTPEREWMGEEALVSYWQKAVSYELGEEYVKGLQLYYSLLNKHDLLPEVPELNFFT